MCTGFDVSTNWTYGCDALGGVVDFDVAAEAASGGHVMVVV